MKLIAQNPYRVLGVFANEPFKKRIANISRISAFQKVSKECRFECDFVDIFGPVDRSEESIKIAIAQLSQDSDAEYYSYFWLHCTDGNFPHYKDSNDILQINKQQDTIDQVVNIFVVSFYVEKPILSVDALLQLFGDRSFSLSDDIKSKIINALISNSSSSALNNWWDIFKDKFAESPTYKLSEYFLATEFNSIAISSIRRTLTDSTFKKDFPTWKNLSNIHNWTKPIINVVKETGVEIPNEIRAEGQIVLSDYADIMLRACIRYYESSDFWEAKSVEQVLELLRDVYRISFSSGVKEHCSSFGRKLKEQIKFLAPEQVRSEAQYIHEQIEDFCKKEDYTYWALVLLKNCVGPLLQIRTVLGEDNVYYRRISTKIAEDAIYVCETHLDNETNLILSITSKELKDKCQPGVYVVQALELYVNLKQLDLEEQFVKNKLSSFRTKIEQYAKQNRLVIAEEPAPTITFLKEKNPYDDCIDYQSLLRYVLQNPSGKHTKEAQQRIWDIEDKAYPQLGTSIAAYKKALFEYKKKYPTSHKDHEVMEELNLMLLGTSSLGTVPEYKLMLELWPEHSKKAIILGRIDLVTFKGCCNTADWLNYLTDFPFGQHRQEAKQLIDKQKNIEYKAALDKCISIDDYKNFIVSHPGCIYIGLAKSKVEELIYKEVLKNKNYGHYYKLYPNGKYTKTLKDKEGDDCFLKCKTTDDYKNYVKHYPNGYFVKEAQKHIVASRNKKLVLMIAVVLVGIISISLIVPHVGNDRESEYVTVSQKEEDPREVYAENSLETGETPYAHYFGEPIEGSNYIDFKTSGENDYIAIVKSFNDGSYINHIYIKGGEESCVYVPDGDFIVYFYSGKGWNPNKQIGQYKGGFVANESMQKDGPVSLYSAYLEYTLYPVAYGNLKLKEADMDDVFN